MKISMRKLSVALFGISALVISLLLWTHIQASSDQITVCTNKAGLLRLIEQDEECKKHETRLSWNQQGPQGPQGQEGKSAQQPKVFDDNGQYLGTLLNVQLGNAEFQGRGEAYSLYNETIGALVFLIEDGLHKDDSVKVIDSTATDDQGTAIYFIDLNCSGQAYTKDLRSDERLIWKQNRAFKTSVSAIPQGIEVRSRFLSGFPCEQVSIGGVFYAVQEVIPFDLPIVAPLRNRP